MNTATITAASSTCTAFLQWEGRPVSQCSEDELFRFELELGKPYFSEFAATRRAAREDVTRELRRRGLIAR